MRKTSVYLSDVEYAELKRLAAETGKSEASIVREAITEYGERRPAQRRFRSAGAGPSKRKRGTSIADEDPDELVYQLIKSRLDEERAWRSSSTQDH